MYAGRLLLLATVFGCVLGSVGLCAVLLPSVVGQDSASATSQLQALGLVVALSYEYSSSEAGLVIGQSPASGSTVEDGSTVTLIVSRGAVSPEAYNYQGLIYCLLGMLGVGAFILGLGIGVWS